ncbi:MAG: preprotein translocase subunit YajC, partial [Desulfovibrio sp.]|nr:preprotein translocase subunit YajC [Desulfovibrio sp.]
MAPQGAAAGQPAGSDMLLQFLPLILMFVIFWFLLIRPQQKRQKAHKQMLSELKKG